MIRRDSLLYKLFTLPLILLFVFASVTDIRGQCTSSPSQATFYTCGQATYTIVAITPNTLPGTTHKWYHNGGIIYPTRQYQSGLSLFSELTQSFGGTDTYQVSSVCPNGSESTTSNINVFTSCSPTSCTDVYISPSKDPNTICTNDIFYLTAMGGTNPKWRKDNETSPVISQEAKIQVTQSGMYYLEAINSCGVTKYVGMNVVFNSIPFAYIFPSQTTKICSSCSQTFSTDYVNAGSYVWSQNGIPIMNANSQSFTANQSGNYSVSVSSPKGCGYTTTGTTLKVNILPIVSAGPDKAVVLGTPLVILNGSASDEDVAITYYSWTFISGPFTPVMTGTNTSTLSVSNLQKSGTYIFRLTTKDELEFNSADVKIIVDFPVNNYNYIRTNTLLQEGIKDLASVSMTNLGADKLSQSTTYFDGLGRPMQSVQTQASRSHYDIVLPITYDYYDRDTVKYLSYVSSENNGIYKINPVGAENNTYSTSPQYLFYQNTTNVAHDAKPYSVTIHERSPLHRVLEKGAAGVVWQPGADHAVKSDYKFNAINEVQQWDYVPNSNGGFGSVKYITNYPPNILHKNITTDSNNNQVIEFRKKEGPVVLKKVQNGVQYLYTYYIYDDLNQVRAVIPPQAFTELPATLTANYTLTKVFLNNWCFTYHYDARKRLVEKKVPGAGKVNLLYDKRDRLVFSQDSLQRIKNEWLYTKYDAFNRAIISGKHLDSRAVDLIQTSIEGQTALFETRNTVGIGYTQSNCFPQNADTSKIISITFYDDYDFLGREFWDNRSVKYAFTGNDLTAATSNNNVSGLATGTKTRILKSKNWEYAVNYYDEQNRVIQSVGNNYAGGLDKATKKFDFSGKVLISRHTHTGIKDAVITQSFKFDHTGRLLKIYHQVGNDSTKKILLTDAKYNELGQLIDKSLGVKNNVPLQSIDYRYNIRGWLTSINNSGLNNDGILNDDANDVFGMELLYERPLGLQGLGLNYNYPSLEFLKFPVIGTESLSRLKYNSKKGIRLN